MGNEITITKLDYIRLRNLLLSKEKTARVEAHNIFNLSSQIERALKVESREITPDYVTMNSSVSIKDVKTNRSMAVKLVYPGEADFKKGHISVLSPLGMALLGCKQGQVISYRAPRGEIKIFVGKIEYQPEASGEYTV